MSATASAPVMGPVPPGEDLLRTLEASCAAHGVTGGRVQVTGALRRVVLRAAAGATPIALDGPLELVTAVAIVGSGPIALRGVVSWDDRGQPRMLAGQLLEAVSDGAMLVIEAWQTGAERRPAPARAPAPSAPTLSPAAPASATASDRAAAPSASARTSGRPTSAAQARLARAGAAPPRSLGSTGRGAFDEDDDEDDEDEDDEVANRDAELHEDHVDLSTEQRELSPRPLPPSTGSGWAGVVAASQQATRAGRPLPSADDLGFDVDGPPDLQRGDVLFHARLGRCVVLKGAGGGDKIKVQRAAGAHVDLSLKALAFRRRPDEGGRRVYEVRAN